MTLASAWSLEGPGRAAPNGSCSISSPANPCVAGCSAAGRTAPALVRATALSRQALLKRADGRMHLCRRLGVVRTRAACTLATARRARPTHARRGLAATTPGACTTGGSGCPAGSTYRGAGTTCAATSCPSGAHAARRHERLLHRRLFLPRRQHLSGSRNNLLRDDLPKQQLRQRVRGRHNCASASTAASSSTASPAGASSAIARLHRDRRGPLRLVLPKAVPADFGPVGPGGISRRSRLSR